MNARVLIGVTRTSWLNIRTQVLTYLWKGRLEFEVSVKGVEMSSEAFQEIENVNTEHRSEIESLPTTDFKRIFWDQQVISACMLVLIDVQSQFVTLILKR